MSSHEVHRHVAVSEEPEKSAEQERVPEDVPTRVARGVSLLDERKPGWVGLIDLSQFDISRTDSCILGQLYKDQGEDSGFYNGLHALGLDMFDDAGADEGFDNYYDRKQDEFPELQKEWVRVITVLRQRNQVTVTQEPEQVTV